MRDLIFEKVNPVTYISISETIDSYKEHVKNSDNLEEVLCSILDEQLMNTIYNNVDFMSELKLFMKPYEKTLMEIKRKNDLEANQKS